MSTHRENRLACALIVYGDLERMTGGNLYDRVIVSALRARGYRVDILRLPRIPYLISPFQAMISPLRAIRRGGWDILIVDELVHPVMLSIAARKKGRQFLATLVHLLRASELSVSRMSSTWIGHARLSLAVCFERTLLNGSDLIVANSRATADEVRRLAGKRVPVEICLPGKDYHGRREKEETKVEVSALRQNPTPEILAVGNLSPVKGYDFLIDTLSGLVHIEWHLTIAGDTNADPEYTRRIKDMISMAGLEQRISLDGLREGESLRRLYRRADIFIHCAKYEAYGIAPAEALTYGLPCLALDVGGIREVFCAGESIPAGLLVSPGDKQCYRRYLEALILSPALRRELSVRALRAAARLPTWEDTGRCFADLLSANFEQWRKKQT